MSMDFHQHTEEKMRIIQELVPGKQVTLAHIIANPDASLYEKISLEAGGATAYGANAHGAIGIVTMSPAESTIIAADVGIKSAGVTLGFVDRVSGTLIFTGTVSEVEAAMRAIMQFAEEKLGFSVCDITKT